MTPSPVLPFRVGEGWDTHILVPGRPLMLGGVQVPHTMGLMGHSDADALLHAITDALFGAVGSGRHRAAFSRHRSGFQGRRLGGVAGRGDEARARGGLRAGQSGRDRDRAGAQAGAPHSGHVRAHRGGAWVWR